MKIWGTIGGIKNHVHEGIVRRVTSRALAASAGAVIVDQQPFVADGELGSDSEVASVAAAATSATPSRLTSPPRAS